MKIVERVSTLHSERSNFMREKTRIQLEAQSAKKKSEGKKRGG
jgi:hypothetical protein